MYFRSYKRIVKVVSFFRRYVSQEIMSYVEIETNKNLTVSAYFFDRQTRKENQLDDTIP
jgi:hypothetical protein